MLIAYKEQVYCMHVLLIDISLTSNNYGMTVIAQADAGSCVRSHYIFVQNRLQSPLILTGLKFFSVLCGVKWITAVIISSVHFFKSNFHI